MASPVADLLRGFRASRFGAHPSCPRCRCARIHRWGGFRGRHRFRCLGCSRTFSDLTGTPAANLKKIYLLPTYASCLAESLVLRSAAARLGIHLSTSFRWRHRLLAGVDRFHRETLSGSVEVATCRIPESQKGRRDLTRPPRKHGHEPSRRPPPLVSLLFACDDGASRAEAVLSRNPTTLELETAIGPVLVAPFTLMAPVGRYAPLSTLSRRLGGSFVDCRSPHGSPAPTNAARDYQKNYVAWAGRFNGTATRYLPHYLAWHRALYGRRRGRAGIADLSLHWPLDDSAPTTPANRAPRGRGERTAWPAALPPDQAGEGSPAPSRKRTAARIISRAFS